VLLHVDLLVDLFPHFRHMLMKISVMLSCDPSSSVYPKLQLHIECMNVVFLFVSSRVVGQYGHVFHHVDLIVDFPSTFLTHAICNQCYAFL
jgi:hypothetical protein